MSDPKHPDDKDKKVEPPSPQSSAGRSARAGAIGAELGELDFEPDALLESLMPDQPPQSSPPAAQPPEGAPKPDRPLPTDEVDDEAPTVYRGAPWSAEQQAQPPPAPPGPGTPPQPAPPEPPTVQSPGLPPEPAPEPQPPAAEQPAPAQQGPAPRPPARPPAPSPADLSAQPPAVPGPAPVEPFPPSAAAAAPAASSEARQPERTADQPGPIDIGAEAPQPEPVAAEAQSVEAGSEDQLETRVLDKDRLMRIAATFTTRDDAGDDDQTTVWDGDPSDGLESLPPEGEELELASLPPSFPPGLGAPGWEDERPSAAHLAERDLLDDWTARAEWIEAEAEANTDARARARALLVASELWALTGDLRRARQTAGRAVAASGNDPMVNRQHRWLAAAEDDWNSVAASLELEMRASPTPASRAHSAYLSAEVHRLKLDDMEGAKRRLELAARAVPEDPRAHVMKLAQQLGAGPEAPSLRWPQADNLAELVEATSEVTRLRTGEALPTDSAPSPAVAFQQVRRALGAGNAAIAGQALEALARVQELNRASLWLAACLLAPSAQSRPRSIKLLKSLLEGGSTAAVVRALAARSLEQGDASGIRAAVADPSSADAFTPSERVALCALTGGEEASLGPWLGLLVSDESLRPLATAALSSVRAPDAPLEVASGTEASQAEVELARLLVASAAKSGAESPLRRAFEKYCETHEESALSRVLSLELAQLEHDASETADQLAQWPEAETETRGGYDRLLAAALVREVKGALEDAGRDYAGALGINPSSEAATRALVALSDRAGAADLLAGLAEALGDDAQRSLALLEAALCLGNDNPAQLQELLVRAAEAAPQLPFAYRYGEQLARMRGDADQLLEWLRQRRAAATDVVERALDSVREALLIADSDVELAASLMQESAQARPDDVALRELLERLAPAPDPEKGQWREEAAVVSDASAKGPLLVSAALEYQRASDPEGATRAALAACDLGGSELAPVVAEQCAGMSPDAARLSEKLFEQARSENDGVVQRELYERLSRLDVSRGDRSSAILWQNAILERQPEYLTALRYLEHEYISSGRQQDLEPIAAALARLLDENEATAHAMVATRHRYRAGKWSSARELVEIAAQAQPPSLWALRQQSAHARAAGDDAVLLRADRQLCARALRAIDAATLALRVAETAARTQQLDEATLFLARAVELIPDHLVALMTRAEVLEQAGDFEGAAETREALARASSVEAHRLAAWHQAALLWLERVNKPERGVAALEHAADTEGAGDDVFSRLQEQYVAAGERSKLAELLERRLARTTDPEQRVTLEVTRGRALADIGDRGAAKQALSAALDASPDHADALAAFAEVSAAQGDWDDAEQAWIRLARHSADAERQINVYMKLGELYEANLPNPERAELSYLEVLKRRPGDLEATRRLIRVYGELGNPERSVELQTQLVQNAKSTEEKRARTLELAEVYELIAKDQRKARETLERARRSWSNDGAVLRGVAEFYLRNEEESAVTLLLDRAAGDARRALNTGRFDGSFFDVLATVAELRGHQDGAQVARATLAALDGREAEPRVMGAGPAAGNPRLSELLAPDLLSLPLRALLHRTGSALEAAYPVDLRALRATPLPEQLSEFSGNVVQFAASFGVTNLQLYLSPALGLGCLAASAQPAQLMLGTGLIETADEPGIYFLIIRGLTILRSGGAVLARTAPIDLWPVVAAYLSLQAPSWQPQNVDARKFADARHRIQTRFPPSVGPDIPMLALEVAGSLGNRASQLGTAINQWGNRAALLALGDPDAGLRGLAFAAGQAPGPPAQGSERKKWIMRNPEARDLAIFSVSEQYALARAQVGLGQ
jgi:predicted Zn-dependent protease